MVIKVPGARFFFKFRYVRRALFFDFPFPFGLRENERVFQMYLRTDTSATTFYFLENVFPAISLIRIKYIFFLSQKSNRFCRLIFASRSPIYLFDG